MRPGRLDHCSLCWFYKFLAITIPEFLLFPAITLLLLKKAKEHCLNDTHLNSFLITILFVP